MAFSSMVKLAALQRAEGRCECRQPRHAHAGRCTQRISLATASFQHVAPHNRHGHDGLANCEVICAGCGAPIRDDGAATNWS